MLNIKGTFNIEDIAKNFQQFKKSTEKELIEKLKRVGREQVKLAKSVEPPLGYYDDTGDLSSSKGAMVFVNGKEVYNYFTLTDQGKNGIKEGRKFARQIGSETTGIALVIVAGMHYARYVEGNNKDVISGTSDYLVDMLKAEFKI